MKTVHLSVLTVLALAHAGCSEADPSGGGAAGAGGEGGAGTTTTSTSTNTPVAECEEGTIVPGSGVQIDMDSVQATVLDTDGAPVPETLAQLCGLNVCFNGETDVAGQVIINAGQVMGQPAFKFGDGVVYAKLARPLADPISAFPSVVTPKLPPLSEGVELRAGEDASSAGVTLSVPEDGTVDLDLLLYDDPAKHVFRAAAVPKEMMDPAVVDQDPALQMFYALAPIDTRLCPPAKVTAPNTAGFPAGAEVEIFILGLDVGEEWAPYGGWSKVSDGRVSDDGATIASSDGGGLPILTVMGVRLK